jgi:beta-lactamase regulating signal transducer with metallopeptidase domain
MSALTLVNSALSGGPAALVTKATAILLLATCAALGMHRAAAAARHLVWLVALSACAALALLTPLVHRIAVAVPVVAQTAEAPQAQTSLGAVSQPNDATLSGQSASSQSEQQIGTDAQDGTAPPATPNRDRVLIGLWLIGCLIVGGRYVLAHNALTRLVRRSRSQRSREWDATLDATARDAGIRRTVRLLVNDDLSAPITFGSTHPTIVLPSSANDWTDERRRIVLVHELAHVARFDALAQWVANLACALFWFHPAAWLAASRLRAEAEHAADDRVLVSGTPGLTYAAHLLDLARVSLALRPSAAVAVGMLRPSRLEGRFRAMLDDRRSRAPVSLRYRVAATAVVCTVMIPIAGLRTVVSAPSAVAQTVSAAQPATATSTRSMHALTAEPAPSPHTTSATTPLSMRSAAPRCATTATPVDSDDGVQLKTMDGTPVAPAFIRVPPGGSATTPEGIPLQPIIKYDTVNTNTFAHVVQSRDAQGLVHGFVILVRGSDGWNARGTARPAGAFLPSRARPTPNPALDSAIRQDQAGNSAPLYALATAAQHRAPSTLDRQFAPQWIPGDSAWPAPNGNLSGRGGLLSGMGSFMYQFGFSFQTNAVMEGWGDQTVSLIDGNVLLLKDVDGVAGPPQLIVAGCVPITPTANIVARALASVQAAREFVR